MDYGKHFIVAKNMIGEPDRKIKLLEIRATDRRLKKYLPQNIDYFSLNYKDYDEKEKNDYIVNLDGGKIPIKDNSFDIIVYLETLEHLLYPNKIMKEILRIRKPGSMFIVSMPNEYNFWSRLQFLFGIITHSRELFKVTEENRHTHIPNVKSIIGFFSKYMSIKKVDYVWQARRIQIFKNIINLLSKVNPNLFSRIVIIKGYSKK